MAMAFGGLLIFFLAQSIGLIVQLNEIFASEKAKASPGQFPLVILTIIVAVSLFLSTIFIIYEDLAKLANVESMDGQSASWNGILTTQMVSEVFLTVVLLVAINLLHRAETAIAFQQKYKPVISEK